MKRFFFCLGLTACGYTVASVQTTTGEPYRLEVAPVIEPGIDVDAAAYVSSAVRTAVLRSQGLELGAAGSANGRLTVEILDVQIGLGAFSEPNLRAARYQVSVVLRGRLADASGVSWTSAAVTGTAPFLSPPGRIEALDGAGRRAMERASDEAAQRLVAALMVRLSRIEREASARDGATP